MKDASSEARNNRARAISSGRPARPSGQIFAQPANWASTSSFVPDSRVIGVSIKPGRTQFTGKVEGLEYLEAAPSSKARGREGLYQLVVREVS